MAGTLVHHVDATARLPWTATAAKPVADLAALQCGRTARRHDRGGLVPHGGRSCTPAESGRVRSIVSGGRSTRGWRDGACWAAWSSGAPPPDGKNPARTAHGGPRGPRGGVPGRDRTRGHRRQSPNDAPPTSAP